MMELRCKFRALIAPVLFSDIGSVRLKSTGSAPTTVALQPSFPIASVDTISSTVVPSSPPVPDSTLLNGSRQSSPARSASPVHAPSASAAPPLVGRSATPPRAPSPVVHSASGRQPSPARHGSPVRPPPAVTARSRGASPITLRMATPPRAPSPGTRTPSPSAATAIVQSPPNTSSRGTSPITLPPSPKVAGVPQSALAVSPDLAGLSHSREQSPFTLFSRGTSPLVAHAEQAAASRGTSPIVIVAQQHDRGTSPPPLAEEISPRHAGQGRQAHTTVLSPRSPSIIGTDDEEYLSESSLDSDLGTRVIRENGGALRYMPIEHAPIVQSQVHQMYASPTAPAGVKASAPRRPLSTSAVSTSRDVHVHVQQQPHNHTAPSTPQPASPRMTPVQLQSPLLRSQSPGQRPRSVLSGPQERSYQRKLMQIDRVLAMPTRVNPAGFDVGKLPQVSFFESDEEEANALDLVDAEMRSRRPQSKSPTKKKKKRTKTTKKSKKRRPPSAAATISTGSTVPTTSNTATGSGSNTPASATKTRRAHSSLGHSHVASPRPPIVSPRPPRSAGAKRSSKLATTPTKPAAVQTDGALDQILMSDLPNVDLSALPPPPQRFLRTPTASGTPTSVSSSRAGVTPTPPAPLILSDESPLFQRRLVHPQERSELEPEPGDVHQIIARAKQRVVEYRQAASAAAAAALAVQSSLHDKRGSTR
eukprot:TRINITY_DN8304_c0_g1_i1.p1 TRINITY_DN8304_c0_g1~~TRINITY_DN8304_c0_g1_i1.p1  ORF type:complete len:703 (+),score=117.10 TRINITY_DN8304_c0_g1_i1:855-2963(+)